MKTFEEFRFKVRHSSIGKSNVYFKDLTNGCGGILYTLLQYDYKLIVQICDEKTTLEMITKEYKTFEDVNPNSDIKTYDGKIYTTDFNNIKEKGNDIKQAIVYTGWGDPYKYEKYTYDEFLKHSEYIHENF